MPENAPDPNPGRSFGWRLSTAAWGLLAGGLGVALVAWPGLLAYAVGGGLGLVAVLCLASAVLARGGRGG